MTNSKDVYQKSPTIVDREIGGEVILVPIRHNVGDLESIFALNETAGRTWALLDGKRTLAEIRDQIVLEYMVDPKLAGEDLLELIAQLEEIEAVIKVQDGLSPHP